MKCSRCNGLMVKDQVFDLDGAILGLEILRCVNCGDTVDATILENRLGKWRASELVSITKAA